MGFFNHLFGSNSSLAAEINIDEQKRIAIWEEYLANCRKEEELAKFFNRGNINNAINHLDALDKVLRNIEMLNSKELIDIEGEEMLEDEIIADLKRLNAQDSQLEIFNLLQSIANEANKREKIIVLLRKIYDTVRLKLHIIKKLLQRTTNMHSFLSELFELIFYRIPNLNSVFMENYYFGDRKKNHLLVAKITRTIILGEEFNEDEISAEIEFVKKVSRQMNPESSTVYGRFARRIFIELADIAKRKMEPDYDMGNIITQIEELMLDDNLMREVIARKKGRINLSDEQIGFTINAFREAYGESFDNVIDDYRKALNNN